MFKYTDTLVTFEEFPDEISLCINISGCPIHCPECHSKELWNNIGTLLFSTTLIKLIDENPGITCVGFMGGAQDTYHLVNLAILVRNKYPNLKIGWYTGQEEIPEIVSSNLSEFDYIKLGPYNESLGPLTSKTTNQKMYKIDHLSNDRLIDITYKFWNNDKE